MPKARLVSASPVWLPVVAEKTSAGQVARKGLDHYLTWIERHTLEDLCRHLEKAAASYPSVLEHVVFTFYIEDCSRVCSHQLVRHRLASYTQESQRYSLLGCLGGRGALDEELDRARRLVEERLAVVNAALRAYAESAANTDVLREAVEKTIEALEPCVVVPRTVRGSPYYTARLLQAVLVSLKAYLDLVAVGLPYEDARYVLPQAVKTRLVMTVNLRELLHIIKLRGSEEAQWEIRELAHQLEREAAKVIPCIKDLVEAYRG